MIYVNSSKGSPSYGRQKEESTYQKRCLYSNLYKNYKLIVEIHFFIYFRSTRTFKNSKIADKKCENCFFRNSKLGMNIWVFGVTNIKFVVFVFKLQNGGSKMLANKCEYLQFFFFEIQS